MAEAKPRKAEKKSLTHRTLIGFFWSFASTGINAVLQFLVLAILSRLLAPTEFGVVNIANIIVVFAGFFYQFGIAPSLIQRKTIDENHIRSGFTFTMILSVLITAVIWLIAPFFASFYPDVPGLLEITRGMSFLFIVNGVGAVARALNYRNLNFRIKARFGVTAYLIGYGVIGVATALLGFGAWALVWASVSQSIVYSALFLRASPHPKGFQLNRKALGELLSFGSGLTLGEIFNRIANTSDNLIVGATLGGRAVGLYGRAYQLMVLPSQYFGQVLDSVLFTAMSKKQDEPQTLGAVYRRGVVAIALVVTPLSAFLFFLAPEFIHVLLGRRQNWDPIIVPFKIFAFAMLFRTSYKMGDSLCRSSGIVFQRALRQFIFAVLVVAGTWIGHYQGIIGVTVGISVAIALNFLSMAQLSLKVTQMKWSTFFMVHVPALVLTAVTALETWLVADMFRSFAWPDLAVLVGAVGVVGVTLLVLIWVLPRFFLGEDGLWVLKTVSVYFPKPIRVQMNKLQYR